MSFDYGNCFRHYAEDDEHNFIQSESAGCPKCQVERENAIKNELLKEVREWLFDVAERGGKKDLFTLFDERFLRVKK